MSRSEKVAGIKTLQRKLGMEEEDIDGLVGRRTLTAIQESVGVYSFGKRAKWLLVKKYFTVQVIPNKSKDEVFKRICLANGKNWRTVKYRIPNLGRPIDALAYASIHMENDMQVIKNYAYRSRAKSYDMIDIAVSAYFWGPGKAWRTRGKSLKSDYKKYLVSVKAEAKRYERSS